MRVQHYLLLSCAWVLGTSALAQSATGTPPVADLPRAEFVQRMDTEFARFDRDGNGVILPEEVAAAQREAATTEALRQNRQVFGKLDQDGNGQLSPQEFSALANPQAIPIDPTPIMSQFDTDKDGIVTLIEYRIATQSNFDRIDTDRDGIVTAVEMNAAGIVP